MKLAVLAAGAWGTALAISFCARHEVTLWSREQDVADDLRDRRENGRFLPNIRVPDSLQISVDFDATVRAAELLVVATPLAGLRATLERLPPGHPPLLWVCKGLEAGSALLPHQIAAETLARGCDYGALSGPSFAEEVARGMPAAISLAANRMVFAESMARELHGRRLRVYANDDLVGVEVGGAVKNVLAIATGISDGLNFGHNARAALMTRGLAEIARLGRALGARRETFMGLAGAGDLILTCTGDLSRNRRVGLGLAAGQKLDAILTDLGHVAEGVSSAREVAKLARQLGVEMPITEAVEAVLHQGLAAEAAVTQLLARDPRSELE